MSERDDAGAAIIVLGRFELLPENRDAFIESRRAALVATREEPGCLYYVASADPIDPRVVTFTEAWSSREHFDRHLAVLAARSPEELARLQTVPVESASLVQYTVASHGPVGS
jgi:quinol monooxygenase YgiN